MFARMVSSPAPVGIGMSISVAGAGLFPLAAADSFPSAPTDNVIVEALRLSFAYLTTDLSFSRDPKARYICRDSNQHLRNLKWAIFAGGIVLDLAISITAFPD